MKLQYICNKEGECLFPVNDNEFDIVIYTDCFINGIDYGTLERLCIHLEEYYMKHGSFIFPKSYFNISYHTCLKSLGENTYFNLTLPPKINKLTSIRCSKNVSMIKINNFKFHSNSIDVDFFINSTDRMIEIEFGKNKDAKIQIIGVWNLSFEFQRQVTGLNFETCHKVNRPLPVFKLNKDYIYCFHSGYVNSITAEKTSDFKSPFIKNYQNIILTLLDRTNSLPPELWNKILNYFNDFETIILYCKITGKKYDFISLLPLFFQNIKDMYYWIGYSDLRIFLSNCKKYNLLRERV